MALQATQVYNERMNNVLRTLICTAVLALGLASQGAAMAEQVEPEITIRPQGDSIIEEYRVNGVLYMVKVTPKKGPVYYLVDSNGDGDLDQRKTELDPNMLIPTWVLFSW